MTTAPTSTTTADGPPYEVIVVDNGSTDESLDWLRSMDWITLVDRGESTPENWIRAVTSAFDIGLERARGEYCLIMHSDTIVRRRRRPRRTVLRDSAGGTVYYELKCLGYESALIPMAEMMRNMDHIAHATEAILPDRKLDRARAFRKTRRRLARLFHRDDIDALLADDSLESDPGASS